MALRSGTLVCASVASLLVAGAAAGGTSPFADKPCESYSGGELRWGDAPLDDFGPLAVKFDMTGVRELGRAPAPGVHPRILCSPEDLPDVRRRLKETRCGRQIWRNILSWTNGMKGAYDDKAEYARPDLWKGSFGGLHGPVPLFRLGQGGWKSDRYRRLVEGDRTAEVGFFWSVFALEAFRCWVEDDREAARTLAKAVITAMKAEQEVLEKKRAEKKDPRPRSLPLDDIGKANGLAYTYDFLFGFLTRPQKNAIHSELAETTWYHDNYGTFSDATTTRSNWASFSYWLVHLLAIEGEPGFNDIKYLGLYRGWRNFLTWGYFPSGAIFEGEAKCQVGMDGVFAFARRRTRENLCGHPHLRAYATRFLPHSVTPTEGGKGPFGRAPFLKFDLLGSIGSVHPVDVLGFKYAFPDDRAIDWCFRKQVGEDYELVPDRPDGYFNPIIFWAIYATDFDPANDDPAKLGLGNTFFCGERSVMITRSGWGPDAMMLALHTRGATGGHPYADRNAIVVCGAGRAWSTPSAFDGFQNCQNSTVVVDGRPQDLWVPGRMVDFVDRPSATFAVGEAKYAWDWHWRRLERGNQPHTEADVDAGRVDVPEGWELDPHSRNDFAFTKREGAAYTRPMSKLPSWIGVKGSLTPMARRPNYPVRKAFRTAGLVRGERPYALVVDDIQKDDAVHRYDWVLTLESDVQLVGVILPRKGDRGSPAMDVLLAGSGSLEPADSEGRVRIRKGEPGLLVRVLDYETDGKAVAATGLAYVAADKNRRLVVPADAVSPGFKVLVYPFREGDPAPKTTWDGKRTMVTIQIGRQRDVVTFSPGPLGKTNVTVAREGRGELEDLVSVKAPIEPIE